MINMTEEAKVAQQAGTATLKLHNKEIELPVVIGSENERAIDIAKLRPETGHITLDNGFVNTGSAESSITYLNGEQGILRYRGYPVESIAEHCTFIETCYLLIHGELPTRSQLDAFQTAVSRHTLLHEDLRAILDGFPRNAHPMGVMASAVCAMSSFYQDSLDPNNPEYVDLSIRRLLAKLPTITAYAYKRSIGQPPVYPQNDLDYCENFLHMMFAIPTEPYQLDPDFIEALNLLLIVHADHEQNCSTSTVRVVGSSDANVYASISAGICALWGPLHGGANEKVVDMLERIVADGGNVRKFVDMAKDKSNDYRLMGFGHRVYRNFDPRATIIKRACDRLLNKLHVKDSLFEVSQELEEIALNDPYFIERKLYPNVDFYSGVIYRAIGIPMQMFTPMFALGRLPGWLSHWVEMRSSPTKRIYRPRQVYTGESQRRFIPLNRRT